MAMDSIAIPPKLKVAIPKAMGKFFIPEEYVIAIFSLCKIACLYTQLRTWGNRIQVETSKGASICKFFTITGTVVFIAINIRSIAIVAEIAGIAGT